VASIAAAVDDRYHGLVLLLAYGGLRIGEALALERRDVDVLRARVDVHASVSEDGRRGETKTGRRRTVHIPRFVAEDLAEGIRGADGAPVFTTSTGARVRAGNFRRRVFEPAVDAAGLEPRPTIHDLRHTAAALAIAEGAHPKEIADMLGHSTITVTMDVYGGLFPALHERLAERLDEVGRRARPPEVGGVGHIG
jgi:integrase